MQFLKMQNNHLISFQIIQKKICLKTASILIGLEMVGVTMESTHQNVTMITGTVVEMIFKPNIVSNVIAKIQIIRVIHQRVLTKKTLRR